MDIQIDTREKQRAIRKILKTFDDNGVKHFSSKLLVGDYMSLDNPGSSSIGSRICRNYVGMSASSMNDSKESS